MKGLDNLYSDCCSFIGLNPKEMTSSEILALYAFVEQYTTKTEVPQEVIDAAQKVVDKFQKEFHITV